MSTSATCTGTAAAAAGVTLDDKAKGSIFRGVGAESEKNSHEKQTTSFGDMRISDSATCFPLNVDGARSTVYHGSDKIPSALCTPSPVSADNIASEEAALVEAKHVGTLHHQASCMSSLSYAETPRDVRDLFPMMPDAHFQMPRHLEAEFVESESIVRPAKNLSAPTKNMVSPIASNRRDATLSGEDSKNMILSLTTSQLCDAPLSREDSTEKLQPQNETHEDLTSVSAENLDTKTLTAAKATTGLRSQNAEEGRDDVVPLRCKDSVSTDTFHHLYNVETDTHPGPYMDHQRDINAGMRAVLIDWLVGVHKELCFLPETLHLCVQICDRYCSRAVVRRKKLQLVGITALFLACKYEEAYPAKVSEFVSMTDGAYDRHALLKMEKNILRVLDWRITFPTAYLFLDRFLGLAEASPMTRHAAAYYLESTLVEHDFLDYRPSMVSASAVILALNNPGIHACEVGFERKLLGLPKILMEHTGFDKYELWECMSLVAAKLSIQPSRQLTAVKQKYEHGNYLSVSSVVELPSACHVKDNMIPPRTTTTAAGTTMLMVQKEVVKYLSFRDLIYKDKHQRTSACVVM